MKTLTLFHNSDQYEIVLNGIIIQQIHWLTWNSPNPILVRWAELPSDVQEQILNKIQSDEE